MTLAVPTELHCEIAQPFLAAGVPVLVEKPMARSLREADEMIAGAARANVPLAVGHEPINKNVDHRLNRLVSVGDVHRL